MLDQFFLSYEAEEEKDDSLIGEGAAMLVAVHARAVAERAHRDE
ncbi:MAG: hypothetical protein QM753_04810 [Thermomicrobiales bacterium]